MLFIITLIAPLCVKVGILLFRGKHLKDSITPLKGEAWTHKTCLTQPLVIAVPDMTKPRQVSCHALKLSVGESILSLCTILLFYLRIVPTVWYFLFFILF